MTNDECRMMNGGYRFAPSFINFKIERIPSIDIHQSTFVISWFGIRILSFTLFYKKEKILWQQL